MLARRSEEIRFQESPASVLRNNPVRAASQISPLLSTATELMENSGSSGLLGSQLSPPLTETATIFLPVTATTLPATPMLTGTPTAGSDSCFHDSLESVLTNKPVEVAANHLSAASSRTLMRAVSSLEGVVRRGFFFGTASLPPESTLRGTHFDAFGLSTK